MCGACSTPRCTGDSHFSCAVLGTSQLRAQASMSVRSQRMPPAAAEVIAGIAASSGIATLRPPSRRCGVATSPTVSRFHAPTWQRSRCSGSNTSRRISVSYGAPPAAAATSPATT